MQKLITIGFKNIKTRRGLTILIHLGTWWDIYSSTRALTPQQVRAIAGIGSAAIKMLNLPYPRPEKIHDRIADLTFAIIEGFTPGIKPEDLNEQVLDFTYTLLTQGKLTYTEAADFAKVVLNTPMNADAWRMRIKRWTERHNLPLPKPKRGRPSTEKPNG